MADELTYYLAFSFNDEETLDLLVFDDASPGQPVDRCSVGHDLDIDELEEAASRLAGGERAPGDLDDEEVVEIYEMYAVDGLEPAEIGAEMGVALAAVHEAIAHYYRNSDELKDIRYDE